MTKPTTQAELFSTSGSQRHIYSVSQITRDIKVILENTFGQVWVEAELSGLRPSPAGHLYFSLKDEAALLHAVIFRRTAQEVKFKLQDGLKVICFGNIEVYGPHGRYQLIVEKIEPKGLGGAQLALEQLKKKLEKEGLFSPARKRPIPYLPSRIGVVTSLQGAAIKDILQVLERRFSDVQIIISPARVQGEGSREEIARAIAELNEYSQKASPQGRIDVMIVGRGGGSSEDLMSFNEEVVARAICASRIPVISAVGHERDITIADLVADLRAATPSVAAEIVIPKKEELRQRLSELAIDLKSALQEAALKNYQRLKDLEHRLALGIDHILQLSFREFASTCKKLSLLSPQAALTGYGEKLQALSGQLPLRTEYLLRLWQSALAKAAGRLYSLSPLNILGRGYSITFSLTSGEVLKDSAAVQPGRYIRTRLRQGELVSQVTRVAKDNADKA